MQTTAIDFNGESFICRVVKDNQGTELIIGSLELESKLHPEDFGTCNDGFASKEAGDIYDGIFFFTESQNLRLSESELIGLLKQEHPGWF